MRLLVDMNLAPEWCEVFRREGWEAAHWSHVGDPRAADDTIMEWARERGYVVFTHDLDFGALLAATRATGPSVIQVRTQDVLPSSIATIVVRALRDHSTAVSAGAIVTIEEARQRVRLLPLSAEE